MMRKDKYIALRSLNSTESEGTLDEVESSGRLWSNVSESSLKHEPGSLFGAISLVGGTTVGAGILALPAETQASGFIASSGAIVACWIYMVATGILLAEVNLKTLCELGNGGVSLTSMAERTLGKFGTNLSGVAYVLLHYTLLVAYISKAGELIGNALDLPSALGITLFTLIVGGTIYTTSPRQLDFINSGLVVGVLASFFGLLVVAGSTVDISNLQVAHWDAVPKSLPVISLAFVYHNVVPVIVTSLEGDPRKVKTAIWCGTGVPMAMFILWNAAILGTLPVGTEQTLDPLKVLRETEPIIGPLIAGFSLLAVTTSFIGFVLGLTDFVSDYLKMPTVKRAPVPYAVALIPPLGMAIFFQDLFFSALEFAGVFGVLVLFGVMPGAMAWSERYFVDKGNAGAKDAYLVPGGKVAIGALIAFAGTIIIGDVIERVVGAVS
ncbi:hypothetical protein CYMTET_20980 [Cymbomonas tetramitiformis]|uniref:Tyrosine-specific transport protein n=1 Tax=Cymbomonas tetramitiformis TaxID=36881 RepID=A0AAE0G2Z8_9CHLO|nr:hypothetical protein CYMTET_20980 [Cymbomonas tetramitiformis]